MKTLFKSVAIIIFMIVLLIVAATQLISTQDIVNQVSSTVEQSTGRTLTINGEQNLSVFPSLSIELKDVHLSNSNGGSQQDMAIISELSIHIAWLSVFSGELSIDKFVINNPDILLEKNVDGTVNWQLLPETSKSSAEKTASSDGNMALPKSFDISLGQVEVNGGKLTYIDHQSKKTTVIDQLNLAVLLPSLRQALNFSGSVRYMSQVFELESSITTPEKAINNQPFTVKLDLTSALAKLSYEGEILQQGKDISGKLSLSGDSVKALLNWQNIPLTAKDAAFNKFAFTTDMHFTNNKLTLKNLLVNLDALAFKGDTTVTLSTPIHIASNIDLGILNLNPYLPEPSAKTPPASTTKSQPIVWDNSAIDLSALEALNADIAIKSSQLLVRDIKLGKNEIALVLNKGVANVQLKSFQGYEGNGHGELTVNANKKPYKISTKFELANINAEPLLTDAVGFDKLIGKGQLAWSLTTQGLSQRDFIAQLNGELDFNFNDGAVKGLNLAAIAKSASNIMQGNLSAVSLDSDFSNAEKTDFAALTGKFTLNNGVANINNLALTNPFIRISGTGDINLPATTVDLHIKSKLVASTQGQAADTDNSGIEIPIKIIGPFHDIKIRPDISAGAKDKVKEKVKDKLKDKLKGLFG
ncbi:AsmA family protein [Cognaticolwellia aestuarii]|uniref:AsmA family protein n=1 Tax=Cognaticolwellia aestuarii TaxID=329993 RepID=UPI00098599DB|nr:AsmA family protein [Cognaticolwellia aestuarii]